MDRRKDDSARRTQLPDTDQVGSQRHAYGRQQRERRNLAKKIIPFLFIALIVILIARQEIPAVHDWWQMTFSPDSWSAQNTCRQAIIDNPGSGKYLRVLKPGEVHDTADGLYVDDLLVAELAANGFEERVAYTCYLDQQGRLFKLNRISKRKQTESVKEGD